MTTNNQRKYLQIHNLQLNFKSFSIKHITLTVNAGEYFVLLGPTGSGKTVLLETIAGLHTPQEGQIILNGQDITHTAPEKRGIGFVYQDYALFPHLTVAENITFGLAAKNRSAIQRMFPPLGEKGVKRSQGEIEKQRNAIAKLLRIEHLLQRKPQSLSGGEQQRVALARALVVEPRLMLLDEPLSALDPERREELQRELLRIHKTIGTTIIHVTHDFEEAISLGDRIAVMHNGQIVQTGSSESIFRQPKSEFVARFVGTRNIFQAETAKNITNGTAILVHRGLKISALTTLKGKVHYSIRPEDIIVSRKKLSSSVRNCFAGKVSAITNRGMLVYITVEVPANDNQTDPIPFICAITRRSYDEMSLNIGDTVTISFKASAVHVF